MEHAERVQFVAGGEVDAGNLVDDIAQEVTALHAVVRALGHGAMVSRALAAPGESGPVNFRS